MLTLYNVLNRPAAVVVGVVLFVPWSVFRPRPPHCQSFKAVELLQGEDVSLTRIYVVANENFSPEFITPGKCLC